MNINKIPLKIIYIIIILELIIIIGYSGYENYQIKIEKELLKNEITKEKIKLNTTTQELLLLKEYKKNIEKSIASGLQNISDLTKQVENITGEVGTIDKLIKTDPELLQKYSKVFFLSENYFPKNLKMIESGYTYNPQQDLWIKEEVSLNLYNLLNQAISEKFDLKIISAFRSFDTQSQLKSAYMVTYGTGANSFSADQGYSEHQLGTTVDLVTSNGSFYSFGDSKEYQWLKENAHEYGFILSYPKDNTHYRFEPWHWRFVGVKLATDLFENNRNFQNMNQNELDEYLIYLFD